MNIQMRIITEDNIDQLMNMSYSNSAKKMIQRHPIVRPIVKGSKTDDQYLQDLIVEINMQLNRQRDVTQVATRKMTVKPVEDLETPSPEYATGSPAYQPSPSEIPPLMEGDSPPYNPLALDSPPGQLDPNSPPAQPLEQPALTPISPVVYSPHSPTDSPPSDLPAWQRIPPPDQSQSVVQISGPVQVQPLSPGVQISGPVQIQTLPSNVVDFGNPELNNFYNTLPENIKRQISGLSVNDQRMILLRVKQKQEEKELGELLQKQSLPQTQRPAAILQIDESSEEKSEDEQKEEKEDNENPSGGSIKKVRF